MDTIAKLPSRPLGRTGLDVSIVGFGAEALGRAKRTFEDAKRTLNAVLDLGISLIDTASAYGHSEEFIGRALAQRKSEYTLITKCGWTGDWKPAWSPAQIAQTIDESLRKLRLDSLDVLLLHSCPLDDLKRGDVIKSVVRAKSDGKAKFIGYSGDNEALAFAVSTGHFDVIETSFNILDQANSATIAAARERGLGVLLKRPIANAVPGRTEKPHSDYAAQYWPRWQAIGLTQQDIDGLDWLEAGLRFAAFWPGVTSALIGSSHAKHMRANVDAIGRGPLASHITQRLREAFANAGRDWPGLG